MADLGAVVELDPDDIHSHKALRKAQRLLARHQVSIGAWLQNLGASLLRARSRTCMQRSA